MWWWRSRGVFSRNLFRPSFLSCHLLPETNTKAAEIWNFSFAPVTFLSDLLGFPFGERAKNFLPSCGEENRCTTAINFYRDPLRASAISRVCGCLRVGLLAFLLCKMCH